MKPKQPVSATTLLFLVFLHLQLSGAIDWSWWFVTMPLTVPIAIGAIIEAFTKETK